MLYAARLDDPAVGYTQAALHYLMALRAADMSVRLHPIGSGVQWSQMPWWAQPLGDSKVGEPVDRSVAVIHQTPDVVVHDFVRVGEQKNIGLTVTETDRVPSWLVRKLNTLDGLIVPSQWGADVMRSSGVTVPVAVVPHAQGDYWWAGDDSVKFADRPYTFYYIGNWNVRKNPEGVLRAYLRAFPDARPDRRLVLKLSRNAAATHMVEAIVEQECGSAVRLNQDVRIFTDRWSEAQLAWLHKLGDCYVSAHRGEGWGYGSFQAALLGRPVIYTQWSAPCEYLSLAAGDIPVRVSKMVDVASDGSAPYLVSTEAPLQWAEPDMDALVTAYRDAYEERPMRARWHLLRLREQGSWGVVGAVFKEALTELGA